jgi:hypothetical protein
MNLAVKEIEEALEEIAVPKPSAERFHPESRRGHEPV